jgi:hypothetical protein
MKTQTLKIRKRIAKHGNNSIIVIPKLFQNELVPGKIVDIEIKIVDETKEDTILK